MSSSERAVILAVCAMILAVCAMTPARRVAHRGDGVELVQLDDAHGAPVPPVLSAEPPELTPPVPTPAPPPVAGAPPVPKPPKPPAPAVPPFFASDAVLPPVGEAPSRWVLF